MKKPLLIPPVYFFLSVIIGIGVDYIFPKLQLLHHSYWDIAGVIIIIIGVILIIWTWFCFKINKTTHKYDIPTYFIQENLYAYTRNPMYIGALLVLVGEVLLVGNITSLIAPFLFFFVCNFIFIPYEENLMQKQFGKEFLAYKTNVRRWI